MIYRSSSTKGRCCEPPQDEPSDSFKPHPVTFGFIRTRDWRFISTNSPGQCRDDSRPKIHGQEVVATIHAFAARRADGKVISWGWPNYGGDSEEALFKRFIARAAHATDAKVYREGTTALHACSWCVRFVHLVHCVCTVCVFLGVAVFKVPAC